MIDKMERNKQTVPAFNELVFNQRHSAKAVDCYVGATYTQHDPMVAEGKNVFIGLVQERPFSGNTTDHPRALTSKVLAGRSGRRVSGAGEPPVA